MVNVHVVVCGSSTTDLLQGSQEVVHRHIRGGEGCSLGNSVENAGDDLVSVLPGAVLATLVADGVKGLPRRGTG